MKISSKLNELKPVDLNCNVFDVYSYDGLSMQELLCQFFTKINECIKVSNETIDLASWLVNEGLKIEVVNKLMIWLEDGTLENLINVNLFNTLNTKIDNINSQLTHKVDKNDLCFVNIKDFGAKGDGINDDTEALQIAFDSGENIYLPKGVYKITEGLTITNSNITVIGDGVKSVIQYVGDGFNDRLIVLKGVNAIDYLENINLKDFKIDCTKQKYKGGGVDDVYGKTSPSPRHKGIEALKLEFCTNITLENIIINDVYGDGIVLNRCSHCTINNNKLYDCGSGNIIENSYVGYDNHGDGIVAFSSFNINISNNIIINKRTYQTHEHLEGSVNDVYGLPCGRSGLEFEYPINIDSPTSNPNDVNYNPPGYKDFNIKDGFGLTMYNNYVYGYTKGIHMESRVRCSINNNNVIKNHIGIHHTGGSFTNIVNNHICNEGLVKTPQIGYDMYSGGISITEYGNDALVAINNNNIDISNMGNAISIGRANIRINNNSIKIGDNSNAIYEVSSCRYDLIGKGVFITNNEFISTSNSGENLFVFKYYNNSPWKIIENSFNNIAKSNSMSKLLIHGCDVSIKNNILNNTVLKLSNETKLIDVSDNAIYATEAFKNNESLIVVDSFVMTNILNNKFYVNEGVVVENCIKALSNSNRNKIINNVFNIESDFTKVCCYFPDNASNLIVEKNFLNTSKSGLTLTSNNWYMKNLILKDNEVSNPESNYILNHSGGHIIGIFDNSNNIGLLEYSYNEN